MTPPKARCVICMNVIATHDPRTTTQRPKFCDNPECRATYKERPICGRCRRPLTPPIRSATRYHEDCRIGCAFCGGLIPIHQRGRTRSTELLPIYCQKACRDAAWEGQPMPICPACDQPTDFDQKATIWRNPPLYHHHCRPDSRRVKRLGMVERTLEHTAFYAEYMQRQRATYEPFEPLIEELQNPHDRLMGPLYRPRPPHVPKNLRHLCAEPWTPRDYMAPWMDEPARGNFRTFEWELELHPDRPTDRAEQYDDEWVDTFVYEDGERVQVMNPYYSVGPLPWLPWRDEKGLPILNPTRRQ